MFKLSFWIGDLAKKPISGDDPNLLSHDWFRVRNSSLIFATEDLNRGMPQVQVLGDYFQVIIILGVSFLHAANAQYKR